MSAPDASPQHTPGPWKVVPGERMVVRDIMDSAGRTLIAADALPRDAALIAAAPDLLAQLKNAEEVIRHKRLRTTWEDAVLAWVQAAIAKAEGRAQ